MSVCGLVVRVAEYLQRIVFARVSWRDTHRFHTAGFVTYCFGPMKY